ncbi:MAG TPA: hypothetical protein VNM40_04515 [Candidatus Paceibacterota bacterium]|nr:hypothetical protein [Candidatus Paceibacterota bacterium]
MLRLPLGGQKKFVEDKLDRIRRRNCEEGRRCAELERIGVALATGSAVYPDSPSENPEQAGKAAAEMRRRAAEDSTKPYPGSAEAPRLTIRHANK